MTAPTMLNAIDKALILEAARIAKRHGLPFPRVIGDPEDGTVEVIRGSGSRDLVEVDCLLDELRVDAEWALTPEQRRAFHRKYGRYPDGDAVTRTE
tara:strand:+ start:120 stop:407 length:288 start_codon:yes stop_codon:yes gene_type:complete